MSTGNGRSAPIYIVSAQPAGATSSQPVDLSDRVKSFTFKETEKKAETLSLKVRNDDYSMLANAVLAIGTKLTFSWGYADGQMSPQRSATVTKVTGGAELSVEAKGGMMLLHLQRRKRVFYNTKRSDVARTIAQQNGFTSTNIFVDDTEVVLPVITQGCVTDAFFLQDLARKEGFVFSVDYRGLSWRKPDFGQAPRRTFTYFTDPGSGDITAPPDVEQDVRGRPGAVVASGIDRATGKPWSVTSDNQGDAGRGGLAAILGLVGAGKGGGAATSSTVISVNQQNGVYTLGQDAKRVSTAHNQADAQRQADGLFNRIQRGALKVSFPAIGDPTTECKKLITLAGALGPIAGNYMITEVEHTLGSNYTMKIKAHSDGRATVATAPVHSDAAVNYQQGPPAGPPSTTLTTHTTLDSRTGAPKTTFTPAGAPPTPTR